MNDHDQALEQWQNRVTLASNNILELCENQCYKRITGDDGFPRLQLSGETQHTLAPALAEIPNLWHLLGLLSDHVERAFNTYRSAGPWPLSSHSSKAVDNLLKARCIEISLTDVPLKDRELLAQGQHATVVTLDQLMSTLTAAFEKTRDAIIYIENCWTQLQSSLSSAEEEIADLQRAAGGQCSDSENASTCNVLLTELRNTMFSDPIGTQKRLRLELEPLIEQTRIKRQDSELKQHQAEADLRRAQRTLDQLKTLRNETQMTFIKAQDKVFQPDDLRTPLCMEKIEALQRWLEKLQNIMQNGRWSCAAIGVQRWQEGALNLIAQEQASLAANKAPLAHREELRGRLSALQAKAEATISHDNNLKLALEATAQEAKALLYSRQTPLSQAEDLVGRYAALLRRSQNSVERSAKEQ